MGGLAFEYKGAVWTFLVAAVVALGMTFWSLLVEVHHRAVTISPFSSINPSSPRSQEEVDQEWEACWEVDLHKEAVFDENENEYSH